MSHAFAGMKFTPFLSVIIRWFSPGPVVKFRNT
jgi:hypothetical protein